MADHDREDYAAPENQLKQYRLLEKLGTGGMGEVYLAEDLRLGRKVALKMLAPALAGEPERRRLFQREAKAAATLNHPNIVTVHGVDEDDARIFIVMEWVQGESLSKLIPEAGLDIKQFFEWALALTDAIAAAHERSIVHRDLKPTNIMITATGRLKVLDFGLAKTLLSAEASQSEAAALMATATMTYADRIVGTIPYMSPEQAQGKPIDTRSDVFSLGVVFFEMLSGRRPFRGDTGVGLITSILRDPAPLQELRPEVPLRLGQMIQRCLEKNPDDRYQSAGELLLAMKEILEQFRAGVLVAGVKHGTLSPRRRIVRPLLRIGAALLLVAAGYGLRSLTAPRGNPVVAASAGPMLSQLRQVTHDEGPELHPSLSPDGSWLAYATRNDGNWDIFRIRVGGEIPMNLTPETPENDTEPSISPDGNRIAFRSERLGGGIFVMGATGESARRISDFGYDPVWSPDQRELIVSSEVVTDPRLRYNAQSEIWAIDVATGNKRKLVGSDAVHAVVSPNGRRIAYWGLNGTAADLKTSPYASGAPPAPGGEAASVALTNDPALDWSPVWSPDGRFIYYASDRGGSMNLWRLPVDELSGKRVGEPTPVTISPSQWNYAPTFSKDGSRMVFVTGGPVVRVERIRFDIRQGTTSGTSLRVAVGDQAAPHNDWVVFRQVSPNEDIAIVGSDGKGLRKLTDDPELDRLPRMAPDGERVAFVSQRNNRLNVWSVHIDGSHLEPLTEGDGFTAPVWSPDGRQMSVYKLGVGTFLIDPQRSFARQTPRSLPPMPKPDQTFCAWDWSPDQRLLAGFVVSGGAEPEGVWVYELATGRYQEVVHGIIYELSWLDDSRRVIYSNGKALLLVDTVTKKTTLLSSFADDQVENPRLSPDKHWIYYHRTSLDADLWTATLTPSTAANPP